MDPSSVETIAALGLGFAFAGLLASAFELVAGTPARFGLLRLGGLRALASVPIVVFSAPVLIVRNTVRGRRHGSRPVVYVVLATVIACFWSILSGRLVLDLTQLIAGA